MTNPADGLQLRSTVKADGLVELSLVRAPMPSPKEGEVVVRVEATPINPSDLGLLLGGADPAAFETVGTGQAAVARARLSPEVLRMMGARVGHSLQVGNEGAGVVIAAGASYGKQATGEKYLITPHVA